MEPARTRSLYLSVGVTIVYKIILGFIYARLFPIVFSEFFALIGIFSLGATLGGVLVFLISRKQPEQQVDELQQELKANESQMKHERKLHTEYKQSVQQYLGTISSDLQQFHKQSSQLFLGVSKISVDLAQDIYDSAELLEDSTRKIPHITSNDDSASEHREQPRTAKSTRPNWRLVRDVPSHTNSANSANDNQPNHHTGNQTGNQTQTVAVDSSNKSKGRRTRLKL